MPLLLAALQDLWGPPVTGDLPPGQREQPLPAVSTDSRRLAAGALFIPLVGASFDGHAFLEQAIAAGCSALLAERQRLAPGGRQALLSLARASGCHLWWVADAQLAYQQLARLWRQQLTAPVVAVTGSAGKTTTRELIRAVLAPLGPVLASSGNENNDVGVPLTLLKATAEHRALVIEMGMRGLGEIERLSVCAAPDVAVITNIGTAHIGRLGSREAIASAKCEVTTALRPDGLLVIPAGDPLLEAAVAAAWPGRVCRVALAGDALAGGTPAPDLLGLLEDSERGGPGWLQLRGLELRLPLPLPGRHNGRNLLLAVAVARELGVPLAALQALEVAGSPGRNRRLQLGGLTVLDETYNASPEAVLAALELLASQGGRRFAVLGTMLELGEQSEALHRQVAERARERGLDGLVVVASGPEAAAMAEAAAGLPRLAVVATPEQAAAPLAEWLAPGDVLLLKASRGVALERLLPLLADLA
ncbi:MAG: UDP-N-acetylmuramoyl-tripeptide--D-alanyl-D-alanine ligase [Cyanobacteriota bacterium]|nr:UDP-N-acetylmuramoyl-tripeptide--D-alanyl-D-alanine ligase [Cyanobacteriota bacterium]